MTRDGSLRPARTVFEWFQQFVIEQCAMVIAVEEAMPEYFTKGYNLVPCEMALSDGVVVPQVSQQLVPNIAGR